MLVNVLPAAIERFLARHQISCNSRIAVAISGGGDSTALLLGLQELRHPIQAIHVNHHLRGLDSETDQSFVEQLCQSRSIPLELCDGSLTQDRIGALGMEGAAREIRYALLRATALRTGCELIATAHHLRDQAETVLMRLITGSGPLRLRGIAPRANGIIRPLLQVAPEQIALYLAEQEITPRIDLSNSDPQFLRNRIRAELLPLLRELNPRVEEALSESARQSLDLEHDLEVISSRLVGDAITREDDGTVLDLTALRDLPWLGRRLLHREIMRLDPEARDVSAEDLYRLFETNVCRTSVTPRLELSREGQTLRLQRVHPSPPPFELTLRPGEETEIEAAALRLRIDRSAADFPLRSDNHQLFEVPPGVAPAFALRSRREGDRFQPLGSSFEKKLSDFLIDRKIERSRRDALPLLLQGSEIVAVIGVEVSERFRIRGAGETYRVTYERI